jgi:DNA-binding MarR family transcriptional regulator
MAKKRIPPAEPAKPARPARRLSDDLDESIGFLIADTARAVKRALYLRIAQHGIRGGSWFCLRALWQADAVTQRELSVTLGIMEPSVVEMLRSMEREGLVRRERDPDDRRKVRVYLTPRAKKLEEPLLAIADHVNAIMLGGIAGAEETRLKHMLTAIRATLRRDISETAAGVAGKDKTLALAEPSKFDAVIAKRGPGNGCNGTKRSAAAATPARAVGLKARQT